VLKKRRVEKAAADPTARPLYTKADVLALRSLRAGKANEGQQKEALDYIIRVLCGTYDFPYRPDSRLTDIALGRMRVGQDIIHLSQYARTDEEEDS